MTLHIPEPLKIEHDELHSELVQATKAPGAVGAAALEVARLMEPHFEREERFALPPLGILADVVRGAHRADMDEALALGRKLKVELGSMFAEHRQIVIALERLQATALAAGLQGIAQFAVKLKRHAEVEELVLYPAVVLLAEHLAHVMEEEPVL